jgi:formate-dependent nitrite reductase membrane component NrfD
VPSTLFTEAPHWRWLIILYFFIGGLAGGSYFVAALIDFFGRRTDRPLARLGYYVAFPCVVASGIVLTLDLERQIRFWHMLLQSDTMRPMFKGYSPMSIGAWALLLFGAFAFLGFIAAFSQAGLIRTRGLAALRPPRVLGSIITTVGGLFAFFIAGYTGVLLAVTNRPIWADTTLLGLNFLVSAASTSIALLILLGARSVGGAGGLAALRRFDALVLVFELLALIALVISLGSLAKLWLNVWGALLIVGVVIVGIVLPLLMHLRSPRVTSVRVALESFLVLVGGFVFRVVIVLSSELT